MHTVFALLCFVVVKHWLIFPYPSGWLHWRCDNLTTALVPAKQPWWIWINTSCELIMNDYITTTKQSTTKPCAYFLGYTVYARYNVNVLRVIKWQRLCGCRTLWNLSSYQMAILGEFLCAPWKLEIFRLRLYHVWRNIAKLIHKNTSFKFRGGNTQYQKAVLYSK